MRQYLRPVFESGSSTSSVNRREFPISKDVAIEELTPQRLLLMAGKYSLSNAGTEHSAGVKCNETCLEWNASPDRRLHHGFEWAYFAVTIGCPE